jgi:hypothetical protein
MPPARLVIGQLRDRSLPVAAAKFADQLASRLVSGTLTAISPP